MGKIYGSGLCNRERADDSRGEVTLTHHALERGTRHITRHLCVAWSLTVRQSPEPGFVSCGAHHGSLHLLLFVHTMLFY
jgi:hypothetical protein